MAPVIIGPSLARALREANDGLLPPGVAVADPHALNALDIAIRPDTAERMRIACQRTMGAVRAGKVKHAAPE